MTEPQIETTLPKKAKVSTLTWCLFIAAFIVICMSIRFSSKKKCKPEVVIHDNVEPRANHQGSSYDLYYEIKAFMDKQANYLRNH